MIGYLKKARIIEFFRIKNVLDLNFETQVYVTLFIARVKILYEISYEIVIETNNDLI